MAVLYFKRKNKQVVTYFSLAQQLLLSEPLNSPPPLLPLFRFRQHRTRQVRKKNRKRERGEKKNPQGLLGNPKNTRIHNTKKLKLSRRPLPSLSLFPLLLYAIHSTICTASVCTCSRSSKVFFFCLCLSKFQV